MPPGLEALFMYTDLGAGVVGICLLLSVTQQWVLYQHLYFYPTWPLGILLHIVLSKDGLVEEEAPYPLRLN